MRLKVIASAGEILVAPLPGRRVSQVVAVGAGPLGWRGPQPGLSLGRLGCAPRAGAAYGLSWAFPPACRLSSLGSSSHKVPSTLSS